MTNLDSIFKSRDITLPTKVRLVKAMVFPVVAPPLEMRGERREFFPDNEGKGSFLSSYEAETGSSG